MVVTIELLGLGKWNLIQIDDKHAYIMREYVINCKHGGDAKMLCR
jgi:hypothetical protein